MHLVGAVGETQRPDCGVRRGEGEVLGEAARAVGLHGAVDDVLDHLGGGDLDRLDLAVGASVADRVHQPGGLEHQQPQLLDRDPGLGDPLADHALAGQRLAERDPSLDPLTHQLDGPLGQPDRAHAVVDPAGAQSGLRDGEAVALVGDQVRRGDAHPLEPELGVAAVLVVVVAEDRHRADHGEPGGVPGDQQHRLLPVPGGVRVGLAHHDEDLALRVHRPGDPPLAAVHDVLVAVADDAGLDVGRVGGGDVGLGHRERRADLARQQRGEPPLLLFGGAEHRQHLHVPGVRRRAVERGRGEVAGPAGDLGQRRVLEVGQPGAVALSVGGTGEEEVPEAAERASVRSSSRTGAVDQANGSSIASSCSAKTGSEGSIRVAMKSSSCSRSSSVLASWAKSKALPLLDGVETGGDDEVEPLADPVEPLTDGLALEEPVVDPLEDDGELEVGQRQVEPHVAGLAAGRLGVRAPAAGRGRGSPDALATSDTRSPPAEAPSGS